MAGPVEGASHCLGVVHVPKSGGSSLRKALAQISGCYTGPLYFDHSPFGSDSMAEAVPTPNQETIAKPSDLAEIANGHRLIIGHYSGPSLLTAGCDSIAIQVREPRSRILSLYRYWQAQPESVRASWGPWGRDVITRADLPLKEFLSTRATAPAVNNAIARQILGYRQGIWRRISLQATNISRIYCKLKPKLSVVNWSSQSERFLEQICEKLGTETVPTLPRLNVTQVTAEEQKIDDETSDLLRRLTNLDRSLIGRLSADSFLPRRTSTDLDLEFETDATELGFSLG